MEDVQQEIRLSQIPASGLAILDINDKYIGEISLSCSDLSGNILREETIYKNGACISRAVNLEGLAEGTYLINLSCPAFARTLELVMDG